MNKILIIGCTETTKVLVPALVRDKARVSEICIASKNKEECDVYRRQYKDSFVRVITAGIDVTNEEKTLLMMNIFSPTLIINLAPSHLNVVIMDIALKIGASYIDTSYSTARIGGKSLIDEQFERSSKFYEKGLICITGCGFNPAAYVSMSHKAVKSGYLDSISSIDIIKIDATKSDGKVANPTVTDLMRLHVDGRCVENGEISVFEALKYKTTRTFPGMGKRTIYAFDDSVIDSLMKEVSEVKFVRYFTSIRKQHLTLVNTLGRIGMLSDAPVAIKGAKIAPIEYLSEVMAKPEENVAATKGTMNIGLLATGLKDGVEKTVLLYFVVSQEESLSRYGVSAQDYMAATTTLAGIKLILMKKWNNPGVFTPGDYEPELLLDKMREHGIELMVQEDAEPIKIEEVEEEADD